MKTWTSMMGSGRRTGSTEWGRWSTGMGRMDSTMVLTVCEFKLGYWENGKKHGEGVFTYPNKDIYSGIPWIKLGRVVEIREQGRNWNLCVL